MKAKALLSVAGAFAFSMLWGQEEPATKVYDKTMVPQKTFTHEPVQEPIPVANLGEGGSGYKQYFYYGDPCCMYMDPSFGVGSAELADGSILKGIFRYNIHSQKMQAIVEGDTFAFANPGEVSCLLIGEQKFIHTTFVRDDGEVANSWFEVLCEGNCDLLLRRYIKYRVTDGDGDLSNDQLYKLEEYYTRKDGGAVERLQLSKKAILSMLTDHRAEAERFIKVEHLKLKDREDLMKLYSYYNGL